MSRASFRWRVMTPTLLLASLVAAALVALVHVRGREQQRRALENSLGTKIEEVVSILAAGDGRVELASFLELETSYRCSPYEYFYELTSAEGRPLLCSQNLAAAARSGLACPGQPPAPAAVQPHPSDESEDMLVRSQRLAPELRFAGEAGPIVRVGVCLEPLQSALHTDLVHSLIAAVLSLAVLALALWIVIGRSLRSVSDIARHASAISSSNLRERLPRSGCGDELDRLAAVLNEQFAGLERALAQMEAFTSDAAHQLRTPLTRIRGELDLVLAHAPELAAETRARLEDTRDELERLVRTCARLLLLARLDRGALQEELRANELDLTSLVQELVEQVAPLGTEKGVRVEFRATGALRLRCCQALLAEALLNLLDNAIRCTPSGGRVVVALKRTNGVARISVSDTGPGVPEDEREMIFRRFYRGASGKGEGTGLGLAIVRGIARAHGGEVTLHSLAGSGATFQMSLPAA